MLFSFLSRFFLSFLDTCFPSSVLIFFFTIHYTYYCRLINYFSIYFKSRHFLSSVLLCPIFLSCLLILVLRIIFYTVHYSYSFPSLLSYQDFCSTTYFVIYFLPFCFAHIFPSILFIFVKNIILYTVRYTYSFPFLLSYIFFHFAMNLIFYLLSSFDHIFPGFLLISVFNITYFLRLCITCTHSHPYYHIKIFTVYYRPRHFLSSLLVKPDFYTIHYTFSINTTL